MNRAIVQQENSLIVRQPADIANFPMDLGDLSHFQIPLTPPVNEYAIMQTQLRTLANSVGQGGQEFLRLLTKLREQQGAQNQGIQELEGHLQTLLQSSQGIKEKWPHLEHWAQHVHTAVAHIFQERRSLAQILEGIKTNVQKFLQVMETTHSIIQASDTNFKTLSEEVHNLHNVGATTNFLTQRLAILEDNLNQVETQEITPLTAQVSELQDSFTIGPRIGLGASRHWSLCRENFPILMGRMSDWLTLSKVCRRSLPGMLR